MSWSLTLPAIGSTTVQHTCAIVVLVPTLAPKPEREMAVYPTVLSFAGWVRDGSVHASIIVTIIRKRAILLFVRISIGERFFVLVFLQRETEKKKKRCNEKSHMCKRLL